MKKLLLFLAFLGWAGATLAQAPAWVLRNTAGTPQSTPAKSAWQTVAVDPTTAWQLLGNAGDLFATHVARTTNGIDWTYLPITGTPGFTAGNLSAIDATTAYVAQYSDALGGGEVLKTTNGGASWTKVTTTEFSSPGSYLNWVHFFDAATGVAFGDPIADGFEVYRTTDGGAAWQRVPPANIPAPQAGGEAGLLLSYFALGNTVWAGTALTAQPNAKPVRIYKSADRGLTWTVSALTPLLYGVQRLAFQDQNTGIAYNVPPGTSGRLIKTTDGGATWSSITPARTAQGSFRTTAIDAIPGAFVSVGSSLNYAGGPGTDMVSSVSADGLTWRDIDGGAAPAPAYLTVDALSPTVAFVGAITAGPAAPRPGSGGVYQLIGSLLTPLPARNPAHRPPGAVYPNPSANGVFQLPLGADVQHGAHVRARDVVGRQVFHQLVNAAAAAAQRMAVDLSGEKPGVYTVELQSATTLVRYRVVVE